MRETEDQLRIIPQFCFPDATDWDPVESYPRWAWPVKNKNKLPHRRRQTSADLCPPPPPVLVLLSETFAFVLTGEDGSRRFGYCRRLLVNTTRRRRRRSPDRKWLNTTVTAE